MKTIGLIGGMSWESTVTYYQLLNEGIRQRHGGLHSARCLLYSVDFADIEPLQRAGAWSEAGRLLADAAHRLEAAGADLVLLCTNTMHKVAEAIEAAIQVPFLHIADATAGAVRRAGARQVGLLGTRFTMEQDFFRTRLARDQDITCLIPDTDDRETVHRVIYQELCRGILRPESRKRLREIIHRLAAQGAQGIILGCTELGLILDDAGDGPPLFDTTRIHAAAALAAAA